MQNRKVLLVTDTYWPIQGGVEEVVRTIAEALPAPFTPVVVTHEGPRPHGRTLFSNASPRTFAEYLDPAGRTVVPLLPSAAGRRWLLALKAWEVPCLKKHNPPGLFDALYFFYRKAYLPSLMKMIGDASLVHCFSTGYLARCTVEACGRRSVPLVVTPAIHFGRWGDSPKQIAAYASADAIICPTGYFKKQLLERMGTNIAKIEIIPPAIREPDVAPVSPADGVITRPFILFLGRREIHKGVTMLLDALSKSGMPQVQLVVAGPAAGQPLRRKNVIDLGLVPESVKQWLLSHCMFLCVPSADESFGMVYAEAMRCGKPVVALDIPPLRELVENGVSGFLVPSGNTDELAGAVTRLLMDSDLRTRMGSVGRRVFEENYSSERTMGKIIAVYQRLITEKADVKK